MFQLVKRDHREDSGGGHTLNNSEELKKLFNIGQGHGLFIQPDAEGPEGARIFRIPRDQRIAFFIGDAKGNPAFSEIADATRALQAAFKSGNKLKVLDPNNLVNDLKKFRPTAIVLPHPADQRAELVALREQIMKALDEAGIRNGEYAKIYPESSGIVPVNRFFGFDGRAAQQKMDELLKAYPSQMSRNPFHKFTVAANRATVLHHNLSGIGAHAESFVQLAFNRSTNKFEPLNGHTALDLSDISQALFLSPHPDDELAAWCLIKHLTGNGTPVKIVQFTNGHVAQIDGVEDLEKRVAIRKKELAESLRLCGAELQDITASNDRLRKDDQYEHVTRDRDLIFGPLLATLNEAIAARGKKKILLIAPHPQDMHPTHQEVVAMLNDALKKITDREALSILQYSSPWAGAFSHWIPLEPRILRGASEPAIIRSSKVLPCVAGELCNAGAMGGQLVFGTGQYDCIQRYLIEL